MMEHFYIITNEGKDENHKITEQVARFLENEGRTWASSMPGVLGREAVPEVPADTDCALVIGGDGTFLQAARKLFGTEIPLLGINMGTLGYLTEVEVHHVEEGLNQLLSGNYTIESRMMLYGSIHEKHRDVAFNDIVVTRNGPLRVLQFNLYVNGAFLNSYQADGILVSTPNGSTAYNLSAGGPIVEPTASLLVVTPICPHALNSSSIILSDEDEIVIEIGSRRNQDTEAAVTFDGEDVTVLHTGDRVHIRKAWQTTRIVKLNKISFLETLREKLKGN